MGNFFLDAQRKGIIVYKFFNLETTDENDTKINNDIKKLGFNTMFNQDANNLSGVLSKGLQYGVNNQNINYPTAKNVSFSNDDIKALQHSLNAFDFTDPYGKKLQENGVWDHKTEWAWNSMQGKKQDSFSETPDLYHTYEKNSTDSKNNTSSVNLLSLNTNNIKGKVSSWGNKVKAETGLAAKAYDQYKWMIGASLSSPLASTVINTRISNSIKSVEKYKDSINKIGNAYKVRPDIMAGIIFKEQLTQSLPDNLAVWDTYNHEKSTHSIGLAAINPGLARDAWAYVNPDYYNSVIYKKNNAELQAMLTDPDFNIQTLAAALRFIAWTKHTIPCEQLNSLTDDQWRWILYDYNSGKSYNDKVMEYMPYINELLK